MNEPVFRDKRLLEALDHIDRRFIAEVTDSYEILRLPGEYSMTKRQKRRYNIKLAVAAACIVLLSGLVWMLPEVLHEISYSATMQPPEETPCISEEEYMEKYHGSWKEWEYYGIYGDCYASLGIGTFCAISSETVGGYTFEYPNIQHMRIFHDYEMYSLQDAYDLGYLKDDDLAELYFYHTKINTLCLFPLIKSAGPHDLHKFELLNIAYAQVGDAEYHNLTELSIKCYGERYGVYAFISDNSPIIDDPRETVKGYRFIYPQSRAMQIYCDGKIYSLKEAYDAHVIDKDFLEEIYNTYKADNISLYE